MQWLALLVVTVISLVATISQSRKRPAKPNDGGQIVGGEPVKIKDVPYQLSIHHNGEHGCGGSIIAAHWALSAAHCFRSGDELVPKWNLEIVAGTSFAEKGGQKHKIKNVIIHPKFDKNSNFDIALLKVSKPFQLGTPGINCIPLATRRTQPGTKCQVSGWGSLIEGGLPTEQLHKVKVSVISRHKCQRIYSRMHEITKYIICAGYREGAKDHCHYDGGGPLVTKNKLVGVVSWGWGCARPGKPGIYINVYKVRKWIQSKTGRLSCKIFKKTSFARG